MPQRGAAQRSAVLSRGTRLDPASPTPRGAHQGSHHTVLSTADRSRRSQAGRRRQPGEALEPSVLHHLGRNAHGGEVRHHLLGREVADEALALAIAGEGGDG